MSPDTPEALRVAALVLVILVASFDLAIAFLIRAERESSTERDQ